VRVVCADRNSIARARFAAATAPRSGGDDNRDADLLSRPAEPPAVALVLPTSLANA
jgi:hypothetical protein